MTTEKKLEAIEAAYEAATGNWTGLDWPHPEVVWETEDGDTVEIDAESYPTLPADMDEAIVEELKHYRDSIPESEWREAWEAVRSGIVDAVAYSEAVAGDAEAAEDAALRAVEHARKGEWDDAAAAAEEASRIESEYGDDPIWRNLRRALEEEE